MEEPRILKTMLSAPPTKGAGWVAVISVWLCALVSAEAWRNVVGIGEYLPANAIQVFEDGQYWRLFTTMFVHADVTHLVVNAIALLILSYLVWGYFGTMVYPFFVVIFGALVNVVALLTYDPHVTLVGISGVVYLLAGFWLTSFFMIERKHSVRNRLMRIIAVTIVMLIPASVDPLAPVSHRTHAIGAAVGIVLAILHFQWKRDEIRAREVREMLDPEDLPPPEPYTIH